MNTNTSRPHLVGKGLVVAVMNTNGRLLDFQAHFFSFLYSKKINYRV